MGLSPPSGLLKSEIGVVASSSGIVLALLIFDRDYQVFVRFLGQVFSFYWCYCIYGPGPEWFNEVYGSFDILGRGVIM